MAYTPKPQFDEEQRQAAPFTSLTTPSPQSTSSGGTPATPQAPQAKEAPQASTPGAGTGFVNLDRVLAANAGIGADVTKAGQKALSKDASNFDVETNRVKTGISSVPGAMGVADFSNAFLGGAPDLNAMQTALSGKYAGPAGVSYNIGKTGDHKTVNRLTNADTVGTHLAQGNKSFQGGMAGYTPQLAALDRALYGQETGAVKARTGLAAQQQQQIGAQNATAADLRTQAGAAANQQAANAAQTKSQLDLYRQNLINAPGTWLPGKGDQQNSILGNIDRMLGLPAQTYGAPVPRAVVDERVGQPATYWQGGVQYNRDGTPYVDVNAVAQPVVTPPPSTPPPPKRTPSYKRQERDY